MITKTNHCDTHGSYEASGVELMGNVIYSRCPECLAIEKQAKERQEQVQKDLIEHREKMKAGLCKRYENATFDDFKLSTDNERAAFNAVNDIVTKLCQGEDAGSLILSGGLGMGKTLLASAAVNHCLKNRKSASIATFAQIVRNIKETYSGNGATESEVIEYYSNRKLLIIDEIGIQRNTETESMAMFEIINGRYGNMLPTILISNLDISGIKAIIGERSIDRLREGGRLITLSGESKRGKQ